MLKKLLLTGLLGIFSSGLFGQIGYGDYALYMYSGSFSNPALSGIKEYGTSLSYQNQYVVINGWYSSTNLLSSHQLEFGQSLFKGRGGLELQWNHTEVAPYILRNSGALAYSHGFRLGSNWILRAGMRGRVYSHILGDLTNWFTHPGPYPAPGNDLMFSWDAGLSLHHNQGYFALGSFHHNPTYLKALDGFMFHLTTPAFTGELGAVFALPSKKEKNWKWSLQPFFKVYSAGGLFFSAGMFVNYGPLQMGAMMTSAQSMRIAIGLNHKYLRLSYAYAGYNMALSSVNRYSGTPNHELALRFILPGKDKEAGFMKNVYRGF